MTPEKTEEETPKEIIEPHHVDPILHFFVKLANPGGFSMGITLSVKGTTITGDLIGFKEYMNEIASTLRNPDSTISPPGDEYDPQKSLEIIADGLDGFLKKVDKPERPAEMIHLKNVGIVSDLGRIVPMPGTVWRGHLNMVDGFFLGKLQNPPI